MISVKEKTVDFLKKYGMYAPDIDLEKNCLDFLEEMEKGLEGNESSLMMIPTYIGMGNELPLNKPVIAIDAGGTNLRVALIHFDQSKKLIVEDFKLYPMPGTKGEISKEEFFDTIAGYIEPLLSRSDKISFCFSYPADILPNKDGRVIRLCKEVTVRGIEGELLGENLMAALKKRGYTDDKSIIVLNDAVSTLLAGRAAYPERVFDSYIGFILGTGTNICYTEKLSEVKKINSPCSPDELMIINTESGIYDKLQRSVIDLELDSATVNPGDHVFEKTISGAYQGPMLLALINKAADEGEFSKEAAVALKCIKDLESKEIDDFLYYPYGNNVLAECCSKSGDESDRLALYYLIDAIFERIARFVVFSLTATMQKTGKGTNPCSPICITADGSTFYKSKLFRAKLDYYIKSYTNDIKGIYCEFVKVDNGSLVGTAIAGLLN